MFHREGAKAAKLQAWRPRGALQRPPLAGVRQASGGRDFDTGVLTTE